MPELPEVETIVRELKSVVVGKKFWNVEGRLESVFNPSVRDFIEILPGLRVFDVVRKGKFIIFELSNTMRMVVHLRMTGRLMWHKQEGREKFIAAVFNFSDASSLYFSDVRKFGKLWLYPESDYLKATGMIRLGIEPMTKDFSAGVFVRLFSGRRGVLKNTLLRQDIIAGIGNIYADEICFNSGLLPTTIIRSIDRKGLTKIYHSINSCLKEGIKNCGVSVSDFVGTNGNLGKHQHYLMVYGREGEKCYVCKSKIKKTRVAGRGTYYCPKCQR
jgi:formamidopyrimidine-DNA glycosylase